MGTALALRDYQERAVDEVRARIEERPILVAPTGSGKTVMAVHLVRGYVGAGKRVLFVAHRRELIAQAAERLRILGIDSGIILAGERARPWMRVQVASIQTLGRRQHPEADLVVIDEAHHCAGDSYKRLLEHYPHAHIVGLTATPFRLDGKPLGTIFRAIVVASYTDELVEAGVLHRPRFYCGKTGPNLKGLKIVGGDYRLDELAARMNTSPLIGDIVENWQRLASGRRTVCYAVNVEHSRTIVDRFVAGGVRAEHLDGATPLDERARILARLARGDTTLVSNCMVLTEGWDLPALEVAIIARPTASLCLHLQMLGRIMRIAQGKDGAVVLDHAGNFRRHGSPMERIEYSLSDRIPPDRKVSPTKTCPECSLEVTLSARLCDCGYEFIAPREEDDWSRETPGQLEEVDDRAPREGAPFHERERYWEWLESIRERNGYKPGYSLHKYKARFGDWPMVAGGKLVDPGNVASIGEDARRAWYEELLDKAASKGRKPGWAGYLYKDRFGEFPPWKWRSEWEKKREPVPF